MLDIEIADADVQLIAALSDLHWLRLWVRESAMKVSTSCEAHAAEDTLPALHEMSDAGLACVENMTTLTALYLRGCACIGDAGLVRLKRLSGLTTLKLQTTGVTDVGLDDLKHLSARNMDAGAEQSAITPAGLEKIGRNFPKLEDPSLLDCASVSDAGFQHLAALTGLRRLALRGTQVSGAGLIHLKAAGLEKLDLSQTPLTTAALKNIARFSQLTWLNLWLTQIDDEGMEHLAGLPKLAWLNLDNTRVGMLESGIWRA